jgi:hypothetical protein
MKAPKMFRFLVEFMDDPAVRFEVLQNERSTLMNKYGFTPTQVDSFVSLQPGEIMQALVDEAKGAGADIVKTLGIVHQGQPCDPLNVTTHAMPMSAASSYDEGQIHVRCVDPPVVPAGTEIILRAHGFGRTPEFELRRYTNDAPDETNPTQGIIETKPATVSMAPAVADDLFQRVGITTPANATAGKWFIFARNAASEDFNLTTGRPFKYITLT